jgi:hypothetical protein
MERDPYDTSIDWMQQPYSDRSQQTDFSHSSSGRQEATGGQREYAYTAHTQPTPQTSANASPRTAPAKQAKKKPNMPKQRALALVGALKKGIIVSSVVSFGFLGLLSANHLVSTTSSNTVSSPSSSSSSSTTKSSGASSTTSSSSSTTQSSGSSSTTSSSGGSSLNQQNGGYGFGSSNSSQGSASGTSVS